MKSYIYSILCACVLTGVVCVLAPEKNGMSKYISFACALAVALTLLSPLVKGDFSFDTDGSFAGEAESQNAQESEMTARYKASSAADVVCAVYGIDKKELSAAVNVSDGGEVTEINIYGDTIVMPDKTGISAKLTEIFGIRINVYDKDDLG